LLSALYREWKQNYWVHDFLIPQIYIDTPHILTLQHLASYETFFSARECKGSHRITYLAPSLTLILPTWRIWWAPNNASRLQMGFNLEFKGLNIVERYSVLSVMCWSETNGPSLTAELSNSNRCPACRHANRTEYSTMCGAIHIAYRYNVRAKCNCLWTAFRSYRGWLFRDSTNTFPLHWNEKV